MFSLPADDEDLFVPQNSSNLAKLFGTPTFSSGSTDLMYVAPKQPKDTPKSQAKPLLKATKPPDAVLFAKVVKVFKTENALRKMFGKYGLALVGNSGSAKEMLLYKDKQNVLARASFTKDFEMNIENKCIDFNDNNKQKWYLEFEDEKHLKEFLGELEKSNIKVNVIVEVSDTSSMETSNSDVIRNENDDKDSENISQSRAEILSRMAKMGQAILPNITKSKIQDSDDNFTSTPAPKEQETPKEANSLKENQVSSNLNKLTSYGKADQLPTQQLSPYMPVIPSEYLPSTPIFNTVITSQEFNLFASESRIQNSEVRMNLSTITNKLDNMMSEISKIREPNTDKLENEFLKSKIADLERNVDSLTKRLGDSHTIETDRKKLEMLLEEKDLRIKEDQQKIEELQNSLKHVVDLQKKLEISSVNEQEMNAKITALNVELGTSKQNISECATKNMELEQLNDTLQKNNEYLNETIKALELKNRSSNGNPRKDMDEELKKLSDVIKDSMNSMYQNIMGQIGDRVDQNQIKAILSTNIKQTTFNVIQKFQECLSTTENSGDALVK